MLTIDIKYANMISNRLDKFKLKTPNPYLANFRCPFCGDSKTNKFKTRGYLFEQKDHLNFKCQNCGFTTNLAKLVKSIDEVLYQEYLMEIFKEKSGMNQQNYISDISKITKKRFQKFEPLKDLKPISKLNIDHPAKKYVINRRIPSNFHYKLFYAPKFYEWVNKLIPDKFDEKSLAKDEPRLVIPFIDRNGYVFGFQGRAFNPKNTVRYITIMLDEEKIKIFGLDDIKEDKTVYIVEGPIDSMFIENSLAMAGSDIDITKFHQIGIPLDKLVIVYDNEPRNPEILKKIESVINAGLKTCIWPTSPFVKEDINDLIKKGRTSEEIKKTIDDNTYSGLEAMVKFSDWKKYNKK